MNLLGVVSVSGKPGLWKALAQNKTGYILESLDEHKTKMVANVSTSKIAALNEITIFGTEDDIKLTDVFENMKAATSVPDTKVDGMTMRRFFREVAPDHDEEKVYASDMKKVITWFNILKALPLFDEVEPGAVPAAEAVEEPVAEPVAEVVKSADEEKHAVEEPKAATESPAKPKAKKTAAKKA